MTEVMSPVVAPLVDGRVVMIRRVDKGDALALRQLHADLSDDNSYVRFFSRNRHTGDSFVRQLTTAVGQPGQGALVAESDGRIIALATYIALAEPTVADVSFVVADPEQAHGLGTLLFEHLASLARSRGVRVFTADVLSSNYRMLHVFRDIGLPMRTSQELGDVQVEIKLDADDAYLDAVAAREIVADRASLRPLLHPGSVAVVGASRREKSVGHAVLSNLLEGGFPGPVYAVNPHAESLLGITCHASVSALPGVPDLAVLCVPADRVPEVAEECGRVGVRALTVLSAGLTGNPELQDRLRAAVRDHGMRLIGPNCLGVASRTDDYTMNATFARRLPPPGPIGVVTQSGGVGIALLEQLDRLGLGLSTFVSTGDKYDVSSNDVLMWWEGDPATTVAVLYLESFGNPRKFSRIARRLGQLKPVLAIRSGTSDVARRAAASHTAAAATPAVTRDALFHQAGVVAVDDLSDLVATATVLACQPLPASARLAIVSNAGGAGVLAADACAVAGLELPDLAPESRGLLSALLPPTASTANPVDTTAGVAIDTFAATLRVVLSDPSVDGLIAISAPTALADYTDAIADVAAGATKPVLLVRLDQGETVDLLPSAPDDSRRLPSFADPEQAVAAYARAARYSAWRSAPRGYIPDLTGIDLDGARRIIAGALTRDGAGGWLEHSDVEDLLRSFGIPVAQSRVAYGEAEAVTAGELLGAPVALKAVVPGLLHKTDRGGVVLNLADADAVTGAYRSLGERFGDELRGVVVQAMVPAGVETLVGVVSDPTFGPLVVFGAGGVITDLVGDRISRLAPVTDLDAAAMVRGLRSSPLLFGYRGATPADHAAVEDVVLRVSHLADALPEIAELELNPLVVHADGVMAVDARVRVLPRETVDPYLRRLR